MDELWRKSWENPGDRLHERPIFKGFAFLFSNGAHGIIASSLAISFASRVVQNHAQWQIAPASKRFAKASVESWREIKRDVHEGAVLLEVSFREANRELRVPRIYEPLE